MVYPVGTYLSLSAWSRPLNRHVVAHDDLNVSLDTRDIMTDLDSTIAIFRKRSGLADSFCVSFESVRWPGRYLRRWGETGVRVSGPIFLDPGFQSDATFRPTFDFSVGGHFEK
jgi:Alpha-L-arabinofuranosidase B (ABFB) domain